MISIYQRVARPSPTVDDYWMAIYRRKGIIFLVAIAAGVACWLISKRITPQYEARAVFYVPQDAQDSVGIGTNLLGARLPSGLQDHAKAFAEIIDQPDAWRAVHELHPQKPLHRFPPDVDIMAARQGTIEIYVRDRNPEVAAAIANALVDYFNEFNREIILGDLEDSIELIDVQIGVMDDEIFDAIRDRGVFLEEHGIASLMTRQTEMERTKMRLEDQLCNARMEEESVDDRIASLEAQLAEEAHSYETGEILVTSPELISRRQSLATLEVRLAGLRAELTDEHPDVESLAIQATAERAQIAAEVARLIDNKDKPSPLFAQLRQQLALLRSDRAALQPRITGIQNMIADAEEDIREIPGLITQTALQDEALTHLRAGRANMEGTRNTLITGSLDIRETALVIQAAEPPVAPTYPRVTLNVAVAGILGVILGVIYALILEHAAERRRLGKLRNLEIERWTEKVATEREGVPT